MVMDNLSRPYSSRLCKWDLIVKPRRLDFPLLTVLDVAFSLPPSYSRHSRSDGLSPVHRLTVRSPPLLSGIKFLGSVVIMVFPEEDCGSSSSVLAL